MENQHSFSFYKNLEDRQKEEREQEKRLEEIREETYNRLKNSPEVKRFLEPYNSFFHDLFLQNYATEKSLWTELKAHYLEQQTRTELEMVETARNAIVCLLKKKLRDIRREWGAGLIELPGISTPFDFMLLVDNVFSIDWLPPVTAEEIEILLDFVDQQKGFDLSFQFRYEAENFEIPLLMEEGNDFDQKNSFAAFHSAVSGKENLRVLPDKRGEEFMRYIRLAAQKEREAKEDQQTNETEEQWQELYNKPFIPKEEAWFIEEFIRQFDDKETLRNFQIYKIYSHKYDPQDEVTGLTNWENVEDIVNHLKNMDVQLPVNAHADWRLALIESWRAYRKTTVKAAIEQVYDEYIFHIQAGIAWQTNEVKPKTRKKVEDLMEKYRKGMELEGE